MFDRGAVEGVLLTFTERLQLFDFTSRSFERHSADCTGVLPRFPCAPILAGAIPEARRWVEGGLKVFVAFHAESKQSVIFKLQPLVYWVYLA